MSGPNFNHTRGDSPATPCPICIEQMNLGPAQKAWFFHLDSCDDCNYDRDCTACSADGEHAPGSHACNCEKNGTGQRLRKAADDERARQECEIPPPGWRCTRSRGHDGPCAAVPREGVVEKSAKYRKNPPTTPPPETAEFYRQLFVATYDALQGTDQYGVTFGDDPRVVYASGDKTPRPIESLADVERSRFGYDRPVTIVSLRTAQDAAQDQCTHIREALEAAEKYVADDLESIVSMFPAGVHPVPDTQAVIDDQKALLGRLRLALGRSTESQPQSTADLLTDRLSAMRVQLAESVEERLAALRVERGLRKTLAVAEKALEIAAKGSVGPKMRSSVDGLDVHATCVEAIVRIRAVVDAQIFPCAGRRDGMNCLLPRNHSGDCELEPVLGDTKYLAAIEALLTDLPTRCCSEGCGKPAEWLYRGKYDNYENCKEHKERSAHPGPWEKIRTGATSLAMARAAIAQAPK